MNHTKNIQLATQTSKPKRIFALLRRSVASLGIVASMATGIVLLANAQQPGLKITDLGTNQFLVEITNSVSTTNYTLYWTPVLANPNYPWIVLTHNNVGESNFLVDASGRDTGFFKVLVGTDLDGDGVPEWQDAQPENPSVGILSITIDSPVKGVLLQ